MREKDIKRIVTKQLKKKFPHWHRLSKKEKKKLAKQVLEEVTSSYRFNEEVSVPLSELTGTPALPAGIIPLNQMEQFVANTTRSLFAFSKTRSQKYLKDPELKAIDELLDDIVINQLLASDSYTPSMRILFPCNLLRAELLRSLKYSEFSYRKYCKILNSMESKTERAFVHLPLHKKVTIDHSQLSQFRKGLTLRQMINMTIYIIYLLIRSGKLSHPFSICGVDSTDLATCCSPVPLATVTIGKKKVRIYTDLDADCGKRRKKRNKSEYFVGYRLHTLVAIDPKTGQNYPLFSLVAPGNHHDNLFITQILSFSQAMGLDIKVVTADEAYADAPRSEFIRQQYGVTVITTPKKSVKLPENVDPYTHAVYMNEWCEVAMDYMGRTDKGHEFRCGDEGKGCLCSYSCVKYREIPMDAGLFGQIPDQVDEVELVRELRKHIERAYNLLKHREGLESLRVRSQHGVMAVSTFAHMSTLLLEIVGTRKSKSKKVSEQHRLAFAA